MDRMACIDLPAFPFQLLLRKQPDWRAHPVAVVDSDRPQGKVLWLNERAREKRVVTGMRYAAALSLAGDLRAAEVPAKEIAAAVADLGRRLRNFTPRVEPSAEEPGVFWLDARGLGRLYESLHHWVALVRHDLEAAGYQATVVVGFTRFGTYALARAGHGVTVLRDPDRERAVSRDVPLRRLAIRPRARDDLEKLAVTTVGQLIDLPAAGIARRFGPEALRLHRLASGDLLLPFQPEIPATPALQRRELDYPETVVERLMVLMDQMMPSLLSIVRRRGRAVGGIRIGLAFDRLGEHVETVRPADPTLDGRQLLDLILLRLQAVGRLPDGVVEIVLLAEETDAVSRQHALADEGRRRDLAAANRALARVRAEFGEQATVRAVLREGHLPEGRFAWQALGPLPLPRPRSHPVSRLVRRILLQPMPLPRRSRREPDGWMLRGLQQGPVVRVAGPYIVSGGWWRRPVHREYHFAETRKGELLWVFYDRTRRQWFLHGRVE
jgi:protein ImuB